MKYKICVEFFYYEGTYNVPEDGVISEHETREQADHALAELDGARRYDLHHGEYARPNYSVVVE